MECEEEIGKRSQSIACFRLFWQFVVLCKLMIYTSIKCLLGNDVNKYYLFLINKIFILFKYFMNIIKFYNYQRNLK